MIYMLKHVGKNPEICLRGHFTFVDYGTFREISQLLDKISILSCSFDLSDLDFIDSAGLGMLLMARDKMISKEGHITLKGVQGQVRKMLSLGNLEHLFVVE